jgi:NADH-quinone oxidoreductase subunit E
MGNAESPVFSAEAEKKLDWYLTRYATKRAALLPALHVAQKEFGWLSEPVMNLVAKKLELAAVDVYEAATFYTLYHRKPKGKHCVWVCTNLSCFLNGADDLLEHVEKKLGIKAGETTADGRVSLFSVECLANCDRAPTAQVDEDYVDRLTPESMDRLLEKLS